MRLFLAIDLPKKTKVALTEQLKPLRLKYPDFSWIDSQSYHITTHFIGETTQVKQLEEKISQALYDQEKFYLYSFGLNMFMQNRITIYLNFIREKRLEMIVEQLRLRTGVVEEKKFIPHLTVAKYRIPSKQQYFLLQKNLAKQKIDIELEVKKMVLFQTVVQAGKSVYKKVRDFDLL